jgi:MFS family permease
MAPADGPAQRIGAVSLRAHVSQGIAQSPFRVLRYPAYRRIWIATTASAVGTWLRQLAASIMVLEMSGSAALVGLVNFLGYLPIVFLMLPGGQIVDRTSSRTVLIAGQIFSGTAALILAILAFTDHATTGVLLVAMFVIGAGYAFTKPATQSLIPALVPPAALSAAISVYSLQFTIGLALGPLLAGIVLHSVGPGAAFALDALSFFVLLLAAWRLPATSSRSQPAPDRQPTGSIGEALIFVGRHRALVVLLVAMSCNTVAIEVVKTLMPIFAVSSFSLSADAAGLLISVFGAGTLLGAAVGPSLEARRGLRAGIAGLALLGASVIVFARIEVVVLGCLLLLAGGIGFMIANVVITTNFFRAAPAEMRGRIFAIFALSFLGVSPFAAIFSGVLAQTFGASASGTITGAFALIGAAVLLWHSHDDKGCVDAAVAVEPA